MLYDTLIDCDRRQEGNQVDGEEVLEKSTMTGPRIHSDAVVSLASLQPGLCISGSKDKVWIYSSCNFKLYSTDISCF